LTTFGMEIEFQDNAELLVEKTHMLYPELLPSDSLHSYHCDCNNCMSRTVTLRAQRDSSCSGELITKVFNENEFSEFVEVLDCLQEVAVEVDAVPGTNAGVHVHVVPVTENFLQCHELLWQFMRWEDAVIRLANGRFPGLRPMNTSVQESNLYNLHTLWYDYAPEGEARRRELSGFSEYVKKIDALPSTLEVEVGQPRGATREWWLANLFNNHYEADRHSNLAIRTRHDTWEFRVWNSTRSAWRWEMYAKMSLLLGNYEFMSNLKDVEVPSDPDEALAVLHPLVGARDERLGELMGKQIAYQNSANYGWTDFYQVSR